MTEADRLFQLAREVLEGAAIPVRSRVTAVLARQALERGLAEYWERRGFPGFAATSMRCQLICLREYGPPEVAKRAAVAWWVLSEACHHHPYELAPTYGEIELRLTDVKGVLEALES